MIRVALPVLIAVTTPSVPTPKPTDPGDVAERAVTCRLFAQDVASLPKTIRRWLVDRSTPVRHSVLPRGNLYRMTKPVSAFGYTARDLYITSARVLIVADRPLANVARELGLRDTPYSPWSKPAGDDRSIIAYQLHQYGLEG